MKTKRVKVVIKDSNNPKENILVGYYYPEKNTLIVTRKRSIHFFHRNNAWALDKAVLEKMSKLNALIRLIEVEGNKRFTIFAKDWLEKGVEGDFGHRPQIFLKEVDFW